MKIAGLNWKECAQDRGWWQSQVDDDIQQFNVPWASGKQLQLENLKPNSAAKSTWKGAGVAMMGMHAGQSQWKCFHQYSRHLIAMIHELAAEL